MKIVLFGLLTFVLSTNAQAQLSHENLASLCRYGAPDGLAAAWMQTQFIPIYEAVVSNTEAKTVIKECTRQNYPERGINKGTACRFAYEVEPDLKSMQTRVLIPEVLKSKTVTMTDGMVTVFEPGFAPSFTVYKEQTEDEGFQISAICKRADGSGGFFGVYASGGLIELNPIPAN
ncbi:MAG: hypothetical protein V4692_10915 [Bdellovibrionota bacterium]